MSAALTATHAGLVRCGSCEKLLRARPLPPGARARCTRCGAVLWRRKPQSLARSWALLIAAMICYVPANLYPVMEVAGPGGSEADTILSGVQAMFAAGWYPVGLLIFFASITVPILKILSLMGLLISVQRRSHWRPLDRAVLYRVVEIIGRWSMLDVYMLALLVILIKMAGFARIQLEMGAWCFVALFIVLTLVSAFYDREALWDRVEALR